MLDSGSLYLSIKMPQSLDTERHPSSSLSLISFPL